MSLEGDMRQMSEQLELPLEDRGEAPNGQRSGESSTATNGDVRSGTDHLMEEVVEHGNLLAALKRVMQNKGSPGVDGMSVEELSQYLAKNWEPLRAQLIAGKYQPKPVKRQEIPKRGGGIRQLGIPCALDRFVQQAILQVLQPRFDPTFSEHSYGFRPGRSTHQAIGAAQKYIQEGRRWVVDVDIEKFFDRVNHDMLMGKLAKRIADKRMLRLIRHYLQAGMMHNGVVMERYEGTPQGGPLSPLLANVLLDEVDKELEQRGHAFCRYADDCNVYVRSKRAAQRVMEQMHELYAKLHLKINDAKSAAARPWERSFLGYSFWVTRAGEIRRRIAPKALEALKEKVREITSRLRGRNIQTVIVELSVYLRGWKGYFQYAQASSTFRDTDGWIRHRLRALQLKQWKRGKTISRKLRALGVFGRMARGQARSCWKMAANEALHAAMPITYFDQRGLVRLTV